MNIQNYRSDIDKIDTQFLQLVNKRAELALKIVGIKKELSLPVLDPIREKKIIKSLQEKNTGPLSNKAIKEIFSVIIKENRRLEEEVTLKGKNCHDKVKRSRF